MKPHKVSSRAKLAPVLYGDPVLRRLKCEDEGAYLAYVTEIRDTQKGRKVRPSLRWVVGLNRAADCVTARASNECVGGGRMRADFAVSASVGIAAAELAGTWFDGKRRIFARKFSQFSPP